MNRKGDTQVTLASLLGIDQGKICRVRNGQFRRLTPTVAELCRYADFDLTIRRNPASSEILMKALSEVWDGSDAHARLIARLLRDAVRIGADGKRDTSDR